MDDAQILSLLFAREESAITEIKTKYGKLCLHIAQNILGNPEDAEECVQDTYLAIWNKIPPVRPDNLSAFICKVIRNLSLKKLEYNTAKKRCTDICIPLAEIETILPDKQISPAFGDEELGSLISAFLRTEKENSRKVFLRRYWFFDSIAEIAEMYSFSENKVKSMLFRTRTRLREYLKKEGVEI